MKIKLIIIALILQVSGIYAQKKVQKVEPTSDFFQISLILPFCAKSVLDDPKHKYAAISQASREYYEGLTLAIDDFSKLSNNVQLKVFDTNMDTVAFRKILERKEVQNSDLIIGPIMKEGNQMIKGFASKYGIYHVSPLLTLTKSSINDPYLISANPDLKYYADYILNQIKASGEKTPNIIVMAGNESNDQLLSNQFLALKTKYKDFTIKTMEISKYTDFHKYYKPGVSNQVIIASENEFMFNNAIKLLTDSNQYLNIRPWTTRKALEFKNPKVQLWQSSGLTIVSPYYADYQNPALKVFIERYREKYYTEPSEFAINGYEQALYFIGNLISLNGQLEKLPELETQKGMCNYFKIAKKENSSSLQNNYLNKIYFEDLKMKRAENW